MRQANDSLGRLRFGVFEVDLRAGELTKRGLRIRLQEQPFQVLAMLLEKPGELVTREELREKIWGQTVVDFDHGLNKAINKIREALGDSAENPRFVETVARRGYRFLADVTPIDTAAERQRCGRLAPFVFAACEADRLHAHVISCLLDIPNIALDSLDGKVSALYETWTRGRFKCEMASLPADVPGKIRDLNKAVMFS